MEHDLYSAPLVHPAYARASARRIHSQDVWAAARQLYEAGAAGSEVMERYGIGRSAFYERLRNEGWRRLDPDDPPLRDEFDDPDAEIPGPATLLDEAWRALARAVQRGRLAEARGWARLHRELRAVAAFALPAGAEPDLTDSTDSFSSAPKAGQPAAEPTPARISGT